MSFSIEMKTDLSKMIVTNQCCILAELMALVLVIGSGERNNNDAVVKLITENVNVAKRIHFLVKEAFGINPEIVIRKSKKLKEHHVYFLSFDKAGIIRNQNVYSKIKNADVLKILQGKAGLSRNCCRKAFLRGVFLGAGSITNPNNYYHLEIVFKNEHTAKDVYDIITKFNIPSRVTKRKNSFVVYIKDVEHIADFLNVIGAHKAMLDLENVRILKEMRNSVNRIVNCETANLTKIVDASIRHINAIKYLQDINKLEKLPDLLKEIAYLRLEYQDLSLKELGMMLDKPLGKSGVNHRLNKIVKIAEES
ncbi:MAG: DNA-binding protein WhiA [Ignavibacteriales bacterium]